MAPIQGNGLDLGDLLFGKPLIDPVPCLECRRGVLLWLGPDLEQDALVLLQPWIFQRPQHTIFVDSLEDASHSYLPI